MQATHGKPKFQFGAAFPHRHVLNPEAIFSKRNDAGKERSRIGFLKPANYVRFGMRFNELGNDVRIDEKAAQNSTGRG